MAERSMIRSGYNGMRRSLNMSNNEKTKGIPPTETNPTWKGE